MILPALRHALDAEVHPRRWIVFVLLFVLVRGTLVLCVMPALEGWDEYQHVGYVDFLDQHGALPVIGDQIDAEFMREVVRYPQSPLGTSEVFRIGGRDYKQYWSNVPPPRATQTSVPLYEAQHPPGYYAAAVPLYRMLGGREHLVATIFMLRMVNLLLTAAAIGVFMAVFHALTGGAPVWRWATAVLAVHPLFLLAGTRVANDAISLFASSVAIFLIVRLLVAIDDAERWRWWVPAALGFCLGLAAWTKVTTLALLPISLLVPAVAGWKRPVATGLGRRVGCAAMIVATFGVVAAPEFIRNWRLYHAIVPLYEVVIGAGSPKTWHDHMIGIKQIGWLHELATWWLGQSLWVGGWSFYTAKAIFTSALFSPLMSVGLLLGAWRWMFSRCREIERSVGLSVAVCGCFSAALAVHALQTYEFVGYPATCQWYAAAAWPMEILVVTIGFGSLRPTGMGRGLCLALIITCLSAELHGTLSTMVTGYGATASTWKALRRLAELRPMVLGTPTLVCAIAAYLIMGAVLVLTLVMTLSPRRESFIETNSPRDRGRWLTP